jgi:hypothetical protein
VNGFTYCQCGECESSRRGMPETGRKYRAPAPSVPYKTPGQLAYEADCSVEPSYHTGTPRATWDQLTEFARQSWERNPTRRAIAFDRAYSTNGSVER